MAATARRYLHADARGSIVAKTKHDGDAVILNNYGEFGIPGAPSISLDQDCAFEDRTHAGSFQALFKLISRNASTKVPSLWRNSQPERTGGHDMKHSEAPHRPVRRSRSYRNNPFHACACHENQSLYL